MLTEEHGQVHQCTRTDGRTDVIATPMLTEEHGQVHQCTRTDGRTDGRTDVIATAMLTEEHGQVHQCTRTDARTDVIATPMLTEEQTSLRPSGATANGVEFNYVPECNNVPIVADASSNICSWPMDISKHGVVFASAQKNLGPSGLAVTIVRNDLMDHSDKRCPSIMEYHAQHKMKSVYNTPPMYSIYIMNLVLEWVQRIGGIDEVYRRNQVKSKLIYDVIDNSKGFYSSPVNPKFRSRMNVPFRIGSATGDEALEKAFLAEATERRMIGLKGHRSVGGLRASLYNAIEIDEAEALAEFMKDFRTKHGAEL